MYACYIDESGHCGRKYDPNQPVEVLVGVITDLTKLFKTQREQRHILNMLNEAIKVKEIKCREIYSGKKEWYDIPAETRSNLIEYLLDFAEQRKCKFIISPIDSNIFFILKEKDHKIAKIFEYPYDTGTWNIILAIQRLQSGTAKNKGKTFIIFDEQKQHDEHIISLIDEDLKFTDTYTGYKPKPRAKEQPERLEEIVDIPFFSKSHLSIIIQLSDIVAYIVSRYFLLKVYGFDEKYDGELSKITEWYEKIGKSLIKHTNIDPPEKTDELCLFFKNIRPQGWSAKDWLIK